MIVTNSSQYYDLKKAIEKESTRLNTSVIPVSVKILGVRYNGIIHIILAGMILFTSYPNDILCDQGDTNPVTGIRQKSWRISHEYDLDNLFSFTVVEELSTNEVVDSRMRLVK